MKNASVSSVSFKRDQLVHVFVSFYVDECACALRTSVANLVMSGP